MKKLKVGQIGIGHNHGEGKIKAIQKFPELFEVIGYSEESEEWVRERSKLPCYENMKRLTEQEILEQSDVILVETDVWNLTSTAQRCIDAGKPIHLDKPASGTLEEYKHLLDSAKEKGISLQLGYMYRYNHAMNLVKKWIQDGTLGEIYQIDAEMSRWHTAEYRKWLKNFKGGTMYIFGSHLIDLIYAMLGAPKAVHPFLKQTEFEGAVSDDNTFAVLEYDKTIVRITSLSVEVDGADMRRFAVMGSKGTVEIKPLEGGNMEMYLHTADRQVQRVDVEDIPIKCRYDDMVKDLYAMVAEGKKNDFSYEYEYELQKIIYQSIGIDGDTRKDAKQ